MRNDIILCLSLLCSIVLKSQNCPSGDVTLISQAEIDAFSSTHSNCTSISGILTIRGSDITNLDGLSGLQSVGGLEVGLNPILTDINGLRTLNTVTNSLVFTQNPQLANVNGLVNLTGVSGSIHFAGNSGLLNLDGLSNISSADVLIITNNPQLSSAQSYCGLYTLLDPTNPTGLNMTPVIAGNGIDPSVGDITGLGSACPPQFDVEVVPTMGQWSIIILMFLMLIIGIIKYKETRVKTLIYLDIEVN